VVQPPHRAMAPVPLTNHLKYYTTVPSSDSPWLFAMREISDGRRAIGRAGRAARGIQTKAHLVKKSTEFDRASCLEGTK
jgi:hypothetical protein